MPSGLLFDDARRQTVVGSAGDRSNVHFAALRGLRVLGSGSPVGEGAAKNVERSQRYRDVVRRLESVDWRIRRRYAGEILTVIVGGKLLFVNRGDVQICLHRCNVRFLFRSRILRYRDRGESPDHDDDDQELDQSGALSIFSSHVLLGGRSGRSKGDFASL